MSAPTLAFVVKLVARPGLDPDLVRALRESLASFQTPPDKKLLAQLNNNVVIGGFDPVGDDDFQDIRSGLSNEVAEFERGAGPRPADVRPAESAPR